MMRQILLYIFILSVCSVSAEPLKIIGKVIDARDSLECIGASVMVVGTDRGTATDINGNFSIEVEKGAILKFSYVGYYSKEVKILNDSSLVIELRDAGQPITPPDTDVTFDFVLPQSELIKLQQQYESLSGEYVKLIDWDIARVKFFLDKEIRDLCPMPLDQYAKQYICVRHDGDLVYLINFISTRLVPQFKDRIINSLITVDDGGNGFGRAIVNYSTGEVIMLQWNGN